MSGEQLQKNYIGGSRFLSSAVTWVFSYVHRVDHARAHRQLSCVTHHGRVAPFGFGWEETVNEYQPTSVHVSSGQGKQVKGQAVREGMPADPGAKPGILFNNEVIAWV